jgi:hypothetical protein
MALHWLTLRSTYTYLIAILICIVVFELGSYHNLFHTLRTWLGGSGSRIFHGWKQKGYVDPHYIVSPSLDAPHDVKVIGLVFFGRREMVKILDCYLKVLLPSSYYLQYANNAEESEGERRTFG